MTLLSMSPFSSDYIPCFKSLIANTKVYIWRSYADTISHIFELEYSTLASDEWLHATYIKLNCLSQHIVM